MTLTYGIAYFFGGATLGNSIPHLVRGLCGQSFQTPFAKPSGVGLSSSKVNVLWGFFNLFLSYGLLLHVGQLDLHSYFDAGAAGAGLLLIALFSANHFGQFHGGNLK